MNSVLQITDVWLMTCDKNARELSISLAKKTLG